MKSLNKAGCQILFAPSVEEMYPERDVKEHHDFGSLEEVMEGEHRPGHFNGVAVVVKRLFEICLPDKAYFGEKDFQQLMIIRELVIKAGLLVEVIGCPIIREEDGLAMSSRNVRLTKSQRTIAPEIFKTLHFVRRQQRKESIQELEQHAKDKLEALSEIDVEYLSIVDESTLLPVSSWEEAGNLRVFVAAFLGEVRLIDNLRLTET